MTTEAIAKRADWIDSPRRNHGRTAYRKPTKHAGISEWTHSAERQKAYYDSERQFRARILELEEAMAAYQATVKLRVEATKEISEDPQRVGVVHRMRLYAGAALLGAVVFGLAFTWTDHRNLAQAVGSIVAVASYALFSHRQRTRSIE
jgi:hypothetical protein